MVRLLPLLGGLLLVVLAPATAGRAFESLTGELVAGTACEAYDGFRRRSNPDGARLEPGRPYRVLGSNRPDGEWLRIVVPGAEPAERWVARGCGELMAAAVEAGLRPFFDDVDEGSDDPAPPPPPLDALDRAVLEVCGPWGSRPRRAAFRAMLDEGEVQGAVERIFEVVQGGRGRLDRFKDELAEIWFARGAFAHVFCGEPRGDELGGLHYRGRYLELQEAGLAGLADRDECRAEVAPPVYTIGVRYRSRNGGPPRTACPKGYAHDLGATDLLIAASRAWRAQRGTRGEEMCLAPVRTGAGRGYLAVVVTRDGELRTFYPDASPRCDHGGRPSSCACGG